MTGLVLISLLHSIPSVVRVFLGFRMLILINFDFITGKPISDLMTMVKTYRKPLEDIKCSDVSNLWLPCVCRLDLYIPWYPCRLKFCKTSNLASSTYKCGIKTCRRGFRFSYYVKYKQLCLWDVWDYNTLRTKMLDIAVPMTFNIAFFHSWPLSKLCTNFLYLGLIRPSFDLWPCGTGHKLLFVGIKFLCVIVWLELPPKLKKLLFHSSGQIQNKKNIIIVVKPDLTFMI